VQDVGQRHLVFQMKSLTCSINSTMTTFSFCINLLKFLSDLKGSHTKIGVSTYVLAFYRGKYPISINFTKSSFCHRNRPRLKKNRFVIPHLQRLKEGILTKGKGSIQLTSLG
jgi:hypothetical protein